MIPITYMRSSSYGCHEFCPMRYFLEYTLGWSGPGNKKADKGTMLHKVMELLAHAKLAQQENTIYVDPDFGEIYVGSDIKKLSHDVFTYYAKKFNHTWEDKDEKDILKWAYKAVEFNGGMFDPREREIIKPEIEFNMPLNFSWANYEYELNGEVVSGQWRIRGTMDLVTKIDEDTIEVIDWKSGRRLNWATGKVKEYEDFLKDPQLRMYHYAISRLFPWVNQVMMTIYFINDGGPYTVTFEQKDIPSTLSLLRDKFEEISNTDIPELKKSWKCQKFCYQGTTTFEDTEIQPLVERRSGQFTRPGEVMTKCQQASYVLEHRSMASVIENMTKSGHKVQNYDKPGE